MDGTGEGFLDGLESVEGVMCAKEAMDYLAIVSARR